MPKSKHRKKQIEAKRRQVDTIRRKLQLQENKENEEISDVKREEHDDINESKDTSSYVVQDECAPSDSRGWFDGLYTWCQSGIVQSVEAAKDMVFPSRVLKRQLDEAQKRLREMEDELQQIKEQENEEKREQKRRRYSLGNALRPECSPSPIAAPPPPPPPPPPMMPPPTKNVAQKRVRIVLQGKQADSRPAVTLDDLLSVKLKSAAESKEKDTNRRKSCGGFAISMSDLKQVNLKRTRRDPGDTKTATKSSAAVDLMLHRKSLKSVRTPDKTLCEEDCGNGPTPLLTRALKRKFKTAYPSSPSPSRSPLSTVNVSSPHHLSNTATSSIITA